MSIAMVIGICVGVVVSILAFIVIRIRSKRMTPSEVCHAVVSLCNEHQVYFSVSDDQKLVVFRYPVPGEKALFFAVDNVLACHFVGQVTTTVGGTATASPDELKQ